MQRKSFRDMQCPVARGLEHVGEWWTMLILRDAFRGLTRFDEFSESLGIAPNMLARRLNALVESGLMQRQRYNERPGRLRADRAGEGFSSGYPGASGVWQ
jgi:DNA-binding HxlR family transcriptional regulator